MTLILFLVLWNIRLSVSLLQDCLIRPQTATVSNSLMLNYIVLIFEIIFLQLQSVALHPHLTPPRHHFHYC